MFRLDRPIAHLAVACTALLLLVATAAMAGAQERRIALVIGNAEYAHIPTLKNPVGDARLVTALLRELGFDTQLLENTDGSRLRKALKAYSDRLKSAGKDSIGLVFYAGHGIQIRENNYLIPIDADIKKESDAGFDAVHLADLLRALFEAENKLSIVILDACRDNPYKKLIHAAATGLAGFDAPVGTLVSFSTGPGKTAYDGEGSNSPFAEALAAALRNPSLKIEEVFKRVSEQVYVQTARKQLPWFTSSVHGDFFLAKASGPVASAKPMVKTSQLPRADAKKRGIPGKEQHAAEVETGLPVDRDREKRLTFYIQWKFFAADNGGQPLGPESYSPTVDYYGKAAVTREQLLKEKSRYYQRWPNRRFSLLSDTLQAKELGDGSLEVEFEFRFDVENDKQRSVGRSTMTLGLRPSGNDFVVTKQNERVLERTLTATDASATQPKKDPASVDRTDAPEDRSTSDRRIGEVFDDCEIACPAMVVVPPGEFVIGSPAEEEGRNPNEAPMRIIRFPRPFAVGRYEVTRQEFAAFARETGFAPNRGCRVWSGQTWQERSNVNWSAAGIKQTDEHPVTCVNWNDARAYVQWLSQKTSRGYRLLTEAEWEYVARAGAATPFSTGATITTDQANFDGGYVYGGGKKGIRRNTTTEVGSFAPNAFGLHDLHGNIWEWVEDCYTPTYEGLASNGSARSIQPCEARVLRGGSWFHSARNARSADRVRYQPDTRYNYFGFRVARDL